MDPRGIHRKRAAMLLMASSVLLLFLLSLTFQPSSTNEKASISNVALQASFDYVQNRNTITFEDISRGTNVQSWKWTFGDGYSSTEQSPVHTYANTGNYSVQLQIVNSAGQVSLYVKTIWIQEIATDVFSITLIMQLLMIFIGTIGILAVPDPIGKVIMFMIFAIGLAWFLIESGILGG